MTWFERLFGPTPAPSPSDAARTLKAQRRQQDRDRIAAKLVELKAEIASGRIAKWEGWA